MDFIDLRTRAELLEICGDSDGAERLRNLSLEVAREVDLTVYAYQLIWRNKIDEAIEILELNLSAHPESWNVRHSLGEAYEALGDYATAGVNFRIAQSLTDDASSIAHIELSLRRVRQFEAAAS